jgi:gamma-glutamylcyclotransferase (GGCT)/AIG2-like uncharacterized protein YtfP
MAKNKKQWWEADDHDEHIADEMESNPSYWDRDWQDLYWGQADGLFDLSSGERMGDDLRRRHQSKKLYTPVLLSTEPDRYYFAYGSNLHLPQMSARCPDSLPVASCKLPRWRLVFRGVADVERGKKSEAVLGAVYKISERDESALDAYESFPHLYIKEYFDAKLPDGEIVNVMFYKMTVTDYGQPSKGYFDTIADGFIHWGLNTQHLETALRITEQRGGTVKINGKKPHGYAKWITRGVLGHPATSTLVGQRIADLRDGTASVPEPTPKPSTINLRGRSAPKAGK